MATPYLTPGSELPSELPTPPQLSPPHTPPPRNAIEAVAHKCYTIGREWLFIVYTVFGLLVLQSEAGQKLMENPINSTLMTLVFIGLELIHVYRMYKALLLGPKLPQLEMRQVRFMLFCCCLFTGLIMGFINLHFPWSTLLGEESPGKWLIFFIPIWSVLWGLLWLVPTLAQTSYAVPLSYIPF